MKRLLLGLVCAVLLLSVFLTGCAANINERTYSKISVDRQLKASNNVTIDEIAIRKAYGDTAWEELKRIDLGSRFKEIVVGEENIIEWMEQLGGTFSASISGDKLKLTHTVENYALIDRSFVFSKVSEMLQTEKQEEEFREYYGNIDVIGVGKAGEQTVDEVTTVEDYILFYLPNNNYNYKTYIVRDLLKDESEQDIEIEANYLEVPGKIDYVSEGCKFVEYNWITDMTTLEVTESAQLCALTKLGLAFIWKIVILVVIVAIILTVLLTLLLKGRGGRTKKRLGIYGLAGEYKGATFGIKGTDKLIIGRDPDLANIIVSKENVKVSRKHCTISYDKQRNAYCIEDHSSNGTFFNDGNRMNERSNNYLRSGNTIYLGNKDNMFRLL